jgi:hypothetical protein
MQTIIENFFSNNRDKIPNFERNLNPTSDWVQNASGIPYLVLDLPNVPYSKMLEEARSLDDLFIGHRDSSESNWGWSSLVIHGISSQHTDHYLSYPEYADLHMHEVPYTWTEIEDRCPVTVDFFKNQFPYSGYQRIRFMKLAPGGYILPHKDFDKTCLTAINLSLNNPENCEFAFNDHGIVPFSNTGSTIMIANGIQHSVWNRSNESRYHMIVHGWPGLSKKAEFDNLIVKSYLNTIGE